MDGECGFLGGGFGKSWSWPHTLLAAVAAKEVNRPVHTQLTRAPMYSLAGAAATIQTARSRRWPRRRAPRKRLGELPCYRRANWPGIGLSLELRHGYRPLRAALSPHLLCDGDRHPFSRRERGCHVAEGYFSGHQHPRRYRNLAIHRAFAGGGGPAAHDLQPICHQFQCHRHQDHGGADA